MTREHSPEDFPRPPDALRRVLTWHLLSSWPPEAVKAWTRTRMRDDPAWSAHYDALRAVERAAAGGVAFGPGQIDDGERRLLAALAEPTPERGSRRGAAFAALAAAVSVAAFVVVADGTPATDGWAARGAGDAARVGVRARCVDEGTGSVSASAEVSPRHVVDALRCRPGSLLAFSLTNLEQQPAHVFVVGVAETGELRWYQPFDERATSAVVGAGTVDRPLAVAADTRQMPTDARVTLFALFSPTPIEGAAVARSVRTAQARGVPIGKVDRLPLEGVAQARIDLVLRGASGP